jgi:hypothetical protein
LRAAPEAVVPVAPLIALPGTQGSFRAKIENHGIAGKTDFFS